MHALEFLVRDAELDAAQGVGLDQVDEFPGNDASGKLGGQAAHQIGRSDAVEQAAGGAGEADVDLCDAEFDVAVGAVLGEIDVIYADDFAAAGVDDLLVEQILAQGEPALVGFVMFELLFEDVEANDAGGDKSESIVARDERKVFAAAEENAGDAVGLVGGLDEKFGDVADEMAVAVVGFPAQQIGCVQHFASLRAAGSGCWPRGQTEISNMETQAEYSKPGNAPGHGNANSSRYLY